MYRDNVLGLLEFWYDNVIDASVLSFLFVPTLFLHWCELNYSQHMHIICVTVQLHLKITLTHIISDNHFLYLIRHECSILLFAEQKLYLFPSFITYHRQKRGHRFSLHSEPCVSPLCSQVECLVVVA